MKTSSLLFLLLISSVTPSLAEIKFEGTKLDQESQALIKKMLVGRIPSGVHEVNFVTLREGDPTVQKVRVRADASEKRLLSPAHHFWAFLYTERDHFFITVVEEQPDLYYELFTSDDLSLWTSSKVHLKGISVFKVIPKESHKFFRFVEKTSLFN